MFISVLLLSIMSLLTGCFGARDNAEKFAQEFDGTISPEIHDQSFEGLNVRYISLPNANPKAPLLVFIHGAPGSWDNYKSYIQDVNFSTYFHMISVDRLGYGHSSYGEVVASLERQSRALLSILEPHKRRSILLVGHSYGGPVALRMAMEARWIDALILLAPSIDPALEERGRWRYWVRAVKALTPTPLYVTNEEILALKDDLLAMDPLYEHFRTPTYYLHGTADILVPVENVLYAQKKMTRAPLEIKILPKANHFIPWSHREEVTQAISFMKKYL